MKLIEIMSIYKLHYKLLSKISSILFYFDWCNGNICGLVLLLTNQIIG